MMEIRVATYWGLSDKWKNKRLAVFCVGGSPNDNPDVDVFLQNVITEE